MDKNKNKKCFILCLIVSSLFSCSLIADWVTLTDGREVCGIDFKKINKGYLFTLENGKTVFIKTANFSSLISTVRISEDPAN